jgi:hypothetical protein
MYKSVQSAVTSVSFPKTLEDLRKMGKKWLGIVGRDWVTDLDILLHFPSGHTVPWIAPKWLTAGDLLFFYHTKSARGLIKSVLAEALAMKLQSRTDATPYNTEEIGILMTILDRVDQLSQIWTGKIFAVGEVSGRPQRAFDENKHFKGTIYAPLTSIVVFERPVSSDEFKSFLKIGQNTITPVYGNQFNELKKLLSERNKIPTILESAVPGDLSFRDVNKEGFRTANGKPWGKTTVHKILTNGAYCGTLVWGGRPGHPAIHSTDPPVRVENAWPAIIDSASFALVQEKMASKRPRILHPCTIPSSYLLSGFLFCSCGHAMIGRSAKSHQYFYYTCNGVFKKGKDACNARALPKDKLEQLVIEQVKRRILNQQSLEELVGLVNMELDSSHDILREKLDAIDAELSDVEIRLSKLYDALETEKLSLDDLAPRIKALRVRQDKLSKARLLVEAEKITRVVKHVDAEIVKGYARDLECLLGEADVLESKAFLRSFIKRIEIDGGSAKIHYVLPMPPDGKTKESLEVLPMVTFGGEGGTRTPTPFKAHDPKSCSSANSDTSPIGNHLIQ